MTEGAHRNLDVPPGPVRGPGGGSRTGVAAFIGLVAVVAGAIGTAQLAPAPGDPAHRSFAAPTPAPSLVATVAPSGAVAETPSGSTAPTPPAAAPALVPDPSAVLAGTTPRMAREALAAAVSGGTLDGRLVFVDGVLEATPVRCQSLAQGFGGCVDLVIRGLGLPVWQGQDAVPWRADPPPEAWLVTVARAGGLVYIGSLVPDPGGPARVTDVAAAAHPDAAGTLFEVRGWLVTNPIRTCFRPGVAATPCPPPAPFLAEHEPLADGILVADAGAEVAVATQAPEIDPLATVNEGVFLVQHSQAPGGGLLVVARYEPPRAVRALVP